MTSCFLTLQKIAAMKNIRIDYYRYRIRKGRADILLQKTGSVGGFCIPYRYVEANENIAWTIKHNSVEDDSNGDLVIIDCTVNDCHLKKGSREWVSLTGILDIDLQRNESYHVYHNILRIFMHYSPSEGELGLRRRASEMLETVKINIARKEYVDELKNALERKRWVILDASMTPPDPELVKKEIETLDHFRLHKPNDIPMNLRDGTLLEKDKYSYEPIDWEEFGAEIKPNPIFGRMFKYNRLIDEIDDTETE